MDLEVDRSDLRRVRVVEETPGVLAEGEARLAVDQWGFSANNVTYAAVGDLLGYWRFFPAHDPAPGDSTRWGRVPVWGFGTVRESGSAELAAGERLFGYFPMSQELIIRPGRGDEQTVSDVSEHRAPMPSAYNSYRRCAADPSYRADREPLQMLLYPLFFTSFVIDDFLADHHDFGVEQVVISSASAKTAIGEAFLAHERHQRVVGLTSPGNRSFTGSLGVYDQVLTYEQVDQLEGAPAAYIDISGDRDLLHRVHRHLGDHLRHSMTVGDTHWDRPSPSSSDPPPGPPPTFLFAPDQITKRVGDWGRDRLDAKVAAAWDRFVDWVPSWLQLRRVAGAEGVIDLYRSFVDGRVDPSVGFACTLGTGGAP